MRNYRSLIQTAGRAARNVNSKVILYADKITDSIHKMITETSRRREKQIKYNEEHNITPTSVIKEISYSLISDDNKNYIYVNTNDNMSIAEKQAVYYTEREIKENIKKLEKEMKQASKELDFIKAAYLRDEIIKLKNLLRKNK